MRRILCFLRLGHKWGKWRPIRRRMYYRKSCRICKKEQWCIVKANQRLPVRDDLTAS